VLVLKETVQTASVQTGSGPRV
jgi:hypothetical protein